MAWTKTGCDGALTQTSWPIYTLPDAFDEVVLSSDSESILVNIL